MSRHRLLIPFVAALALLGAVPQFAGATGPSAPQVDGVLPTSGPDTGGTSVTISGSNFTGADQVQLVALDGTVAVTINPCPGSPSTATGCFTVTSDIQITLVTPQHEPETVDVVVHTAAGSSTVNGGDQYVFIEHTPTVTAVSPTAGPQAGGNTVTLTGTGFLFATSVAFGGAGTDPLCTGSNAPHCFSIVSDTSLTAGAPASSTPNNQVDVTVVNSTGTSATGSGDKYEFAGAPSVVNVNPATGPVNGGTAVTITGTNFSGAGYTTSEVDLTVVGGGTSFAVTTTPCALPSSANCFTVTSANQIALSTPAVSVGQSGSYDIQVTTPGGTSPVNNPADQFVYAGTTTQPVVSSVTPSGGSTSGTGTTKSIVISGSSFTAATAVKFGTLNSPAITVVNDTTIDAAAPPDPTQQVVDVTVTAPGGTSNTVTADHYTYANAPSVSSLSPSTQAPGGVITVNGAGFMFASSVKLTGPPTSTVSATCPNTGPAPVTGCFTVTSDAAISLTLPDAAHIIPNTYQVQVNNPARISPQTSADQLVVPLPAPTVTGVSPAGGPEAGLTPVTITGTNFYVTSDTGAQTTSVSFGATSVTTTPCPGTPVAACFTVTSTTSITAYSPAGSGQVHITVTDTSQDTTVTATSATSASDLFAYAPLPTVTNINPKGGNTAGGTSVTITGTNFSGAGYTTQSVLFGAVASTSVTVVSATQITATSPAHAGGTVDITVTTFGGTSTVSRPADTFIYVAPTPVVSSLSPTSGPPAGLQAVTITGTGFTAATQVAFGATSVTTTPCVSPDSAGCFTVVSDTQITASTPAHAPATVDVRVTTAGGPSATGVNDRYTYLFGDPTVSGVLPTAGPVGGGTTVLVAGTNFTGAGFAATSVSFGTAVVTSSPCPVSPSSPCYTINSGTQITAFTPAHLAATVDVIVTTSSTDLSETRSSATSTADQFTFAPAPTVTAVAPTTGPAAGGNSVVITGTSFSGTGYTASAVMFGATAATTFHVDSATQITATAPAEGNATVDIVVTTPGGVSATGSPDHYTFFTPNPQVTSVVPSSGPTTGGTPVTINGTGFSGSGFTTTAVNFGVTAATGVTVVSSTRITVTAPAQAAGTVDVTVVAGGVTSPTSSADHYLYVTPQPTITSVAPSSGPFIGGTTVVITGTDFSDVNYTTTAVKFGATAAASFTVDSATQITATSPAETPATVHIVVTANATDSVAGASDQFTFVSPAPLTSRSTNQFVLTSSDGTTFVPMRDNNSNPGPSITITPGVDAIAKIGGNADLFTGRVGYNQDIAIVETVDGVTATGPPLSWKESGGHSAPFSPNAAYVEAVASLTHDHLYVFTLEWKTNTAAPGVTIYAGAGGPAPYSPTEMTAQLVSPSTLLGNAQLTATQPRMQSNNGVSWVPVGISLPLTPTATGTVIADGNADLFTSTQGFNQDLGIFATDNGTFNPTPLAWKESGGFTGAYSPNAVMVQTAFAVTAGHNYTFDLRWKSNRPLPADGSVSLFMGAGGPSPYSPSRLTVLLQSGGGNPSSGVSTLQSTLAGSNGAAWTPLDNTHLFASVAPTSATNAIVTANADLWTQTAGFNQDIGIFMTVDGTLNPVPLAWKESGGVAATYSPTAAFAEVEVPLQAGHVYRFTLGWKTNTSAVASNARIFCGAGGPSYSPTSINVFVQS